MSLRLLVHRACSVAVRPPKRKSFRAVPNEATQRRSLCESWWHSVDINSSDIKLGEWASCEHVKGDAVLGVKRLHALGGAEDSGALTATDPRTLHPKISHLGPVFEDDVEAIGHCTVGCCVVRSLARRRRCRSRWPQGADGLINRKQSCY